MNAELPPMARAALQRGHKIEAIKIVREQLGVDLKQAKEIVEASPGDGSPGSQRPHGRQHQEGLPSAVADALARGHKIEAIRIVRKTLGIGLKEAKEYVEQHGSNAQNATSMVALVRRRDSSGGWRWLMLLLVIALAAVYWFKLG